MPYRCTELQNFDADNEEIDLVKDFLYFGLVISTNGTAGKISED